MSLVATTLCLAVAYVCMNVALTLLRNYRAHKFFKTKAPKLPVLPKPNILWGHILRITGRRRSYRHITELHEKYGPTFGHYHAERPFVSTTDLELIKRVELDEAHKHINRDNLGMPFKDLNHSILAGSPESWKRERRALAPALTNHKVRSVHVQSDIRSVLKQFEEGIEARMASISSKRREVEIDCNNNNEDSGIFEEPSIILDLDDYSQRFTLAAIFLITYKKENIINFSAERDVLVDLAHEGGRSTSSPLFLLSICFPWLRSTMENILNYHPFGRGLSKAREFIVEATNERRAGRIQKEKLKREREGDFEEKGFTEQVADWHAPRRLIDYLIDAMLDRRITYDEFAGTALSIMLAGFQTTADAMTCLLWQLARNPDIQEKLRQEVLRDGLDSKYLHWCAMESVRFHPPVPLGAGRTLVDDVEVNGTFVPKGTFVMPSTHTIHHDPKIWPQPERFWPERWENTAGFHPAQFLAFGLGARNCLGGKLAMQEIKHVVHLMVTKYRLEVCPETPKEFKFATPGVIYTVMDHPVHVRVVKTHN